jgi:hypothetical protein
MARILFVHGMGERPPVEEERARSWAPIAEQMWLPIPYESFGVLYWSDVRLATEASPELISKAALRKMPARQRVTLGWATGGMGQYLNRPDLFAVNLIERGRRTMQLAMTGVSRAGREQLGMVFSSLMREMAPYLEGRSRIPIRERIIEQLDREQGSQPLCVVSHSMGTVVALDAILAWGGPVDTFVTLGAPLGWEYVKEALGRPAFPQSVRRWFNLYDNADNCVWPDKGICNDYPTLDGARKVIDQNVRGNYSPTGERDPHHWYGYLTSPELIDIVCNFWLGASSGGVVPAWLRARDAAEVDALPR